MVLSLVIVLVALLLLTLGAELFVRGASILALRLGISPLFVGLTVVGFGTSSPELGASLSATLSGNTGISMGNVVGSNIFNIGFILGLTALLRPITVSFPAVRRDLFVALGACTLPLAAYVLFGEVPRLMGAFFLAALAVYLTAAYIKDRAALAGAQQAAEDEVTATVIAGNPHEMPLPRFLLQVGLGAVGLMLLVFGARLFVNAATDIAETLGVSDFIIGLTVVAVGTSLPELVTSIVAAVRKSSDVAVGNIIGSNIFNVLGILGTCAIVAPQPIAQHAAYVGIPVMILFSIGLIPFVRSGGVLSRREGAALFAGFLAYSIAVAVTAS